MRWKYIILSSWQMENINTGVHSVRKTITSSQSCYHIFRLINFPDFSSIFSHFPVFFSVFDLINLANTKIYLTNILQLKNQRKNKHKNWLKLFPDWKIFSYFSRPCGNHDNWFYIARMPGIFICDWLYVWMNSQVGSPVHDIDCLKWLAL